MKLQNNTILQWDCRGIQVNYEALQQFLTNHNPQIACLQETFLKQSSSIKFKQYHLYNYLNRGWNRASGGVSILVRKDIPQSQIHVDTDLQAIVVKATQHKPIHICSIYIPPHDPISDIKMNELLQQMPKLCLWLGDFNSHSTVWGCQKKNDKKGKDLEKVMQNNNLCI